MKLECEWLVLCEQVLWDRVTENLTLVGCVDQIGSTSFPALKPKFAFAAMFRDAETVLKKDLAIKYRLVRWSETSAKEQIVTEFEGVLPRGKRRVRTFLNFQFLHLEEPETIFFRIDWRIQGKRWQKGCTTTVDAFALELSPEQVTKLEHQKQQLLEKFPVRL